ncbi:c-type cytochrome [Aquabacterium sp. A7-Y]|uniref:cytochrome-c peroxidase n=1 Tax=Aquabacterium sp. A7-Y TaxID=1349605 RepID=UPI00223D0FDA|nr:cytochrome c peroxidase [Aquabacterium sp. A7-Y]MCW7536945.1 c-type cytochrome [Aquabacterium sp. A7-Y]
MTPHSFGSWGMATAIGMLAPAAVQAQALPGEPLSPLPAPPAADPRKLALGSRLFRDPRFAKDNSVSCISCHSPQHGGADARPLSVGAGGVVHVVNTPTVLNSGLNFRQQWTGGATSLEELVGIVLKSPRVFNSSWEELLAKLGRDLQLVSGFKAAYPEGMTPRSVADALAVYQRSLLTPSRFDRYLQGDGTAITALEKHGYERFKAYGCVGCHQGVNIGGNMFQRFGAMADYFKARAAAGQALTDADRGRYNVTLKTDHLYVFKVPSLRNVALTPPYFHDASARSLEEAVEVMFRFQLGRTAPPQDKEAIVAFLGSLSGEAVKE